LLQRICLRISLLSLNEVIWLSTPKLKASLSISYMRSWIRPPDRTQDTPVTSQDISETASHGTQGPDPTSTDAWHSTATAPQGLPRSLENKKQYVLHHCRSSQIVVFID